MRLIQRNRQENRDKAPRIAISQAEITADLLYPAYRRQPSREAGPPRRSGER